MHYITTNITEPIKIYEYYDIHRVAEEKLKNIQQYSQTIIQIENSLINIYNTYNKLSNNPSDNDLKKSLQDYREKLVDQKEELQNNILQDRIIFKEQLLPIIYINYYYDIKHKREYLEKLKEQYGDKEVSYEKNMLLIRKILKELFTRQPLLKEYIDSQDDNK